MASTPSDIPPDVTGLIPVLSQKVFEEWAESLHPPYPLGKVIINGKFDRYFNQPTQSAWEGYQKARVLSLEYVIKVTSKGVGQ